MDPEIPGIVLSDFANEKKKKKNFDRSRPLKVVKSRYSVVKG